MGILTNRNIQKLTASETRILIAAYIMNLSLGVFYGWSILLTPLEQFLHVNRSMLSIVPATALVCFTLGVYLHDSIARQIHPALLGFSVMIFAGVGHLIFWIYPHYISLVFGYGVLFGFSAGVGYGSALILARCMSAKHQGWAIGCTVAAFATGGMIVSLLAYTFTITTRITNLFGITAVFYVFIACLIWLLLRQFTRKIEQYPQYNTPPKYITSAYFWRLACAYFVMSYMGLMVVSHGAAIMQQTGMSSKLASLAPFALNLGYVLGAIFGGIFIAKRPTSIIAILFISLSIIALFMLILSLPVKISMFAIFCIGLQFGSTVSIFMVLLSTSYGQANAGYIFCRINIGYGAAGFLAPTISAKLYDFSSGYTLSIGMCLIFGVLGIVALIGTKQYQ